MKASKEKAITLIALVVTIILLLILAGVTISTLLGEDGLIQRTIAATEEYEDTSVKEELYVMLMDHDISQIDDDAASLPTYLQTRVGKEIDAVTQLPDPRPGHEGERVNVVKKNNRYYMIYKDENGNYVVEEMNTQIGEDGSVGGGLTLATPDSFTGGTLTFDTEGKSALVFSDVIEKPYNFDVRKGDVTIYIDNNMTLTNKDVEPKRSAINIEPGAELTLYIAENVTLTVDSGFGTQGATGHMGEMKQNEGGDGGWAGIRVPSNENGKATLNLRGKGTVVAFGGDATPGGAGTSSTSGMSTSGNGGGRRWTELELELVGNGGKGGESNSTCGATDDPGLWGHTYTDAGHDGYPGEDCGIVNILDNIKVYAYGGAGSKTVPSMNFGTNSGGSGYPAAGIGGGRSSVELDGDWANGAGGYVGTWGDNGDCYRTEGHNGLSLLRSAFNNTGITGVADKTYLGPGGDASSYFSYGTVCAWQNSSGTNSKVTRPYIGGQGGYCYWASIFGYFPSGSGGAAGKGGTVKISSTSTVYAFNGDRITNGDYTSRIPDYDKDGRDLGTNSYVLTKYGTTSQTSPIKIFAQGGTLRNVYYHNLSWGRRPYSELEYFSSILGDQLESSVKNMKAPTNYDEIENHLIRRERTIETTGYINPETNDCYGIGSGAGYIEVSNGTFVKE